ncbi:MAG: lytic murein transglycosylase B [Burkholderiales bacterium]|nr:lytic murein transglycosylase B [Burkholderiales bacterium]
MHTPFLPPSVVLVAAVLCGTLAAAAPAADAAARAKRGTPGAPAAAARDDPSRREDVRAFIDEMARRHGFVPGELETLFSRVRLSPAVIDLITPPASPRARSWLAYRARFLDPARVDGGVALWNRFAADLRRAETQYGVPAEIIVAIIGVETVYGRNSGNWRVIDALATLAFDYPKRAPFFRGELENFLLFVREHDLDVFSVRGSYAGAIGIPQFMPSSWRRWAVDFDGDGRVDLRESFVDAIGSVGSFLHAHGWVAGAPVAFPATVAGDDYRELALRDILPSIPIGDLARRGVTSTGLERAGLPPDTPAALIDLMTPDRPSEYWIGLTNFYVITRYNRSSFYAMSVFELAQAIRARRAAPAAPVQAGNTPVER